MRNRQVVRHVLVQSVASQPIYDRVNSSVFSDVLNSSREAEERTASIKPFQTEVAVSLMTKFEYTLLQ